MKIAAFAVLVVLLILYVIKASKTHFKFLRYCAKVAKETDRVEENADFMSCDEGGLNHFQIQQYRRLMAGNYERLGNENLDREAEELSSSFRQMFGLAILLVTAFV